MVPGGDTICSDGSPYRFFVHRGDPSKLLIEFEGGGACWSGATCEADVYNKTVTSDPEVGAPDRTAAGHLRPDQSSQSAQGLHPRLHPLLHGRSALGQCRRGLHESFRQTLCGSAQGGGERHQRAQLGGRKRPGPFAGRGGGLQRGRLRGRLVVREDRGGLSGSPHGRTRGFGGGCRPRRILRHHAARAGMWPMPGRPSSPAWLSIA